jgi:hypothetical protein
VQIAAVRSKNEFLEVPLVGIDFEKASYCVRKHIIDFEVGTYEKDTIFSYFPCSSDN